MTIRENRQGFTLAELLVSLAILVLLVVFVSRLFISATSVTVAGNKHIDCDLQARQLFDRLAVDFSQMVKRPDVDYYVKSIVDPQKGTSGQSVNDLIAFFSQVPGYYPSPGPASPMSLVAYRINSSSNPALLNRMERMGKGLLWNGASPSNTPTFIFGLTTIVKTWPSATDRTTADPDYETIGPQTFRFEYFYFKKNGTLADTPGAAGMQDVAAISVCIAVIDPKSKALLSTSQISQIASGMDDFLPSMKPGDLLVQWQSALDSTNNMPRSAISAIRLYQRTFNLLPKF